MDLLKNKKGMTLVELMVAIGIVTIAMGGFTLLYLKSLQTNAFTIEEGITAATTSRVVDQIVSEVRRARQSDAGGYPIQSGSDFDLILFANVDDDAETERVHYYLNGTNLMKGVTDPIAGVPVTYPSSDQSVATIATYVVNTASEPIFSYYNKNYPGDTSNNPLATPVSIGSVRLVKIWVRMNIDPIKAPNNINIESFAELRNLNDYE